MRAARHVTVTGRVQGVFFRAWTRQQAVELGVSGWVRNRDDGSVEAHLEGEPTKVEALEKRMRHGPDGARVETFESVPSVAQGADGFEIRR